jgi:uncharacterized membrane protein
MTSEVRQLPGAAAGPAVSQTPSPWLYSNADAGDPITCPICGGENAPDAVFCANPSCRRALGEFKYVLEELREEASWHERLAEKVTAFIGKPHFLAAHVFWLALWMAINTGVVTFIRRFDEYPFGLLGLILAVEAIFITGWILISNNRQDAHADKRAELDYEVSVRNYRQIQHIDATLNSILERLERLESAATYSHGNKEETSS